MVSRIGVGLAIGHSPNKALGESVGIPKSIEYAPLLTVGMHAGNDGMQRIQWYRRQNYGAVLCICA